MPSSRKGRGNGLAHSVDFLIRDTRRLLTAYIEANVTHEKIPLKFWFPLRVLDGNPGMSQRELGRALGFGDARAGVVVDAMVRHKLVDRRRGKDDARRIELDLTSTGRDFARLMNRRSAAVNKRILAGFSAAEAGRFLEFLARAHANLETDERE
jgi:DNA-binding MarR family transcriptional regulator